MPPWALSLCFHFSDLFFILFFSSVSGSVSELSLLLADLLIFTDLFSLALFPLLLLGVRAIVLAPICRLPALGETELPLDSSDWDSSYALDLDCDSVSIFEACCFRLISPQTVLFCCVAILCC